MKTYLSCSALFHLGGSVYSYDPSQEVLYKTLKDFYLKILKFEVNDFDKDLIKIIKKNLKEFCPDITSLDDLQYLMNWTLSAVNEFFQIFPLKKYTPLIVSHEPIVAHDSLLVSLTFDLLLVQNNKLSFIHAVCFYPKLDPHNKNCDFFNSVKIDFLKRVYTKKGCAKPSVSLHNLSIKSASFRNKNTKNYPYTKETVTKITKTNSAQAKSALTYFDQNKEIKIIKPFCDAYSCPKRKECQDA